MAQPAGAQDLDLSEGARAPWQTLLHGLPAAVGVFGPAGEALFLNEAALALFDKTPRLLALDGRAPVPEEKLPWARACRGERLAGEEYCVVSRGEGLRFVLVQARAGEFAGRPAAVVCFTDITKRRAAESELARSERRLAQVFLSNPNAIGISHLPDGRLLCVNDRLCELLGYPRSELLGRTTAELEIWKDPEEREAVLRLLMAGRPVRNLEVKLRRRSGAAATVLANFELIEAAPSGERVVVAMLTDVTERGEMRRSIADFSARYQLLVETIKDYAIMLLDERGRIRSWNVGAERVKGYAEGEILGRPISIFYTPEDVRRGKPQRLLDRAAAEGKAEEQGWRVRKDGTRFWGDTLLTALHDESGRLTGYTKITRDLTERRKAAEVENIKRREEIQREVVATVSHELRTPIAAIRGFIETLLHGALEDRKHRRHFVEIIDKHADRLSRLVEDILNLSALDAGTEGRPASLALKPFVEQAVAGLEPLVRRKSLRVNVRVPARLQARADPDRLAQVLHNLLSNAIKYNKARGSIRVEARRRGERVVFSVSNTGVAIPKAQLARVFERFHRTDEGRRAASGSGLGLSIVKKIVESWKGRVWAQSRGGRTAFHFTVPAA